MGEMTTTKSGNAGGSRLRNRATFLKEFIKAPGVVAAVAPSSRKLGEAMVRGLDLTKATSVVEYGPGTGTFTRVVLEKVGEQWFGGGSGGAGATGAASGGVGGRRFIAIEYNKPLADILAEQHPEVTLVNGSAEDVEKICGQHGLQPGQIDVILSGLGWPSFDDRFRTVTLEATAKMLRPGGEFRTFGYHVGLLMRGAWHFRREVRRLFKEVHISRVVWGNMPPAFVYRCVK